MGDVRKTWWKLVVVQRLVVPPSATISLPPCLTRCGTRTAVGRARMKPDEPRHERDAPGGVN